MNVSESALDLRYNISALVIAILRTDIKTPEQAFAVIQDKDLPTGDTEEWIRLRQEGLSYKEIGEMFGVYASTVHYRLKRHSEKLARVKSN